MPTTLLLEVPTYYGDVGEQAGLPELGGPNIPVIIKEEGGLRIVLGATDVLDYRKPDIFVERRANGWAIFLHAEGGGDPHGYVYFLDDGRSFLVQERPGNKTELINDEETEAEIHEALDRLKAESFTANQKVPPADLIGAEGLDRSGSNRGDDARAAEPL